MTHGRFFFRLERCDASTDPETCADALPAADTQALKGEVRKALRAVIIWNGTHGRERNWPWDAFIG